MEEISLSITKFNIHALIIIGGFEVSSIIEAVIMPQVDQYSHHNLHILGLSRDLSPGLQSKCK